MKKNLLLAAGLCICMCTWAAETSIPQPKSKEIVFTPNQGQILNTEGRQMPEVLAKASVAGLDFYLTRTGVSYVLMQYEEATGYAPHPVYVGEKRYTIKYSRVDVDLPGASITPAQLNFAKQAGWQTSYYYNNSHGQVGVKSYQTLTIKNIYPNIDWVWKSTADGKLEYDYIVHPGGNAAQIKMLYRYADITAAQNHLTISTKNGSLREGDLKAHCNSTVVDVAYNFNKATNEVSFATGNYDTTKDLVIDPPLALQWSAQYGGNFYDGLRGVATDAIGNIYLTGYSTSTNFPAYNQGGGAYFDGNYGGNTDAVIIELDSNKVMLWSTYLGGTGNDAGNSIAVASTGDVYVTGSAGTGFPTMVLLGAYNQNSAVSQDIFITRFRPNHSMRWSTFYGGIGNEEGLKVHLDLNNNLYVAGYTNSPSGSFNTQQANGGYYQSSAIGTDACVMKFDSVGQTKWATLYGGAGDDFATSLATDTTYMVLTGFTTSSNFPITTAPGPYYHQSISGGATDGFIVRFDKNTVRRSASYYGGSGNDYINDVTIGNNYDYIFTGRTSSSNFPLQSGGGFAYNQTALAGSYDAFVVQLKGDLAPSWATYLGGAQLDVGTAVTTDIEGRIFLTGFTFSDNFPLDSPQFLGAYYQTIRRGYADGFIAGFSFTGHKFWSTYKGDSCYDYPADVAFANVNNKFYICGEGLYGCTQSLPDSGSVHGGSGESTDGFCWAFGGNGVEGGGGAIPDCFEVNVNFLLAPCSDTCNGTGTISVSGGTAPYEYFWSNGDTTTSASGLCAGANVEVRDASGCVVVRGSESDIFEAKVVSLVFVECFTDGTGSLGADQMGGTPPYTYAWSTFDTTQIISGLLPEVEYSVVVTDANGCRATKKGAVPWIDRDPPIKIKLVKSPACGETNGILAAVDSLGMPASVEWYYMGGTAGSGDTLFNVGVGTYIINSYGCEGGDTIYASYTTIDTIKLATDIEVLQNDNSCIADNGSIRVNISTFYTVNNPISYAWSNGATTQVNTGLDNGTYRVTVTDASGCTAVWQENIEATGQPQIQFSAFNLIDAICYQDSSGTIIEPIVNGFGQPYSYLWSTGDTTHGLSNVPSGTYSLTVTGSNGCSAVASGLEIGFVGFEHVDFDVNNVSCYGAGDGSAMVNVVNNFGPAPYSYYWSTGATTNTISGVSEGIYHVTVQASNGADVIACVAITEPDKLEASASLIRYDCPTNSEITSVTFWGGQPPYNIAWSNGGTDTLAAQTVSGDAVVVITDWGGCVATDTLQVTVAEAPLVGSYSAGTILCNGQTAAVSIAATGGFAPLTGTGDFELGAGVYTYTVTDNIGCHYDVNFTLTEPAPLVTTYEQTSSSCNGNTGAAEVFATGGTEPYTGTGIYTFVGPDYDYIVTDSNGCEVEGTASITVSQFFGMNITTAPLSCHSDTTVVTITAGGGVMPYDGIGVFYATPGTYTYVVTDYAGCTDVEQVDLADADTLITSFAFSPIVCHGGQTTVIISAIGGTEPYTNTGVFTYPAGPVDITVTDNGGCASNLSFEIDEPAALVVEQEHTNILCHGQQSTVTIVASGGVSPYTGTGTITYPGGVHSALITDANGCEKELNFTINEPDELEISAYVPDTINCTADSVEVVVLASGGVGPYTGTGSYYYHQDGDYDFEVTDVNGCMVSASATIHVAGVRTEIISTDDTICADGAVMLTATGDFTFTWYPYEFTSSGLSIAHVPVSTTISVIGVNTDGCISSDTFTVVVENCDTTGINDLENARISVFPNPATDRFVVQVENGFESTAELNLFASDGKLVAQQTILTGAIRTEIDCSQFASGVYMLRLSSNGRNYYQKVIVER